MTQHHPEPVVENIISLAKQGLPRSEIARQVGMTRNAILGLLHRRGITAPVVTKPARPKRTAARTVTRKSKRQSDSEAKANAIAAAAVKAAAIEAAAKAVSVSSGVTWADLNSSHQCRWPLDGALWCGEAKTIGSYCTKHFNLSRRPHIR
jgi:hypothetical protein